MPRTADEASLDVTDDMGVSIDQFIRRFIRPKEISAGVKLRLRDEN